MIISCMIINISNIYLIGKISSLVNPQLNDFRKVIDTTIINIILN